MPLLCDGKSLRFKINVGIDGIAQQRCAWACEELSCCHVPSTRLGRGSQRSTSRRRDREGLGWGKYSRCVTRGKCGTGEEGPAGGGERALSAPSLRFGAESGCGLQDLHFASLRGKNYLMVCGCTGTDGRAWLWARGGQDIAGVLEGAESGGKEILAQVTPSALGTAGGCGETRRACAAAQRAGARGGWSPVDTRGSLRPPPLGDLEALEPAQPSPCPAPMGTCCLQGFILPNFFPCHNT